MAQIKMDVSEYEAMKENAKLLQKALKKEEELNKEIKSLQQEKIKILEENDKVVTTVLIKRTSETKASYLPQHEIINRIQQSLAAKNSNYRAHRDFINREEMMHRGMSMSAQGMYSFFDSFFETHTHEFETDKQVTRQGLDEVTSVIRKELKEELDKNVQEQLAQLKDLIKEKTSWYEDLKNAEKFGKEKDKEASRLSKQLKVSEEKLETLRKTSKRDMELAQFAFSYPLTMWNVNKYKRELKELVKIKEDDKSTS